MKTVVVGASPDAFRYSYKAIKSLLDHHNQVIALGIREGAVFGQPILDIRERPIIKEVDTLTIYVSAPNLADYEDYLLSLNPGRIIFNPGAENATLQKKANHLGIKTINDCTLVMLSVGAY
ncbi:MAG TPA: CoA-binding protein [Cyclobacteriaceae bacterium]|jgi:hypothetical protein